MQVAHEDHTLPSEHPIRSALWIYAKRLGVFLVVVVANLLLFSTLVAFRSGSLLMNVVTLLLVLVAWKVGKVVWKRARNDVSITSSNEEDLPSAPSRIAREVEENNTPVIPQEHYENTGNEEDLSSASSRIVREVEENNTSVTTQEHHENTGTLFASQSLKVRQYDMARDQQINVHRFDNATSITAGNRVESQASRILKARQYVMERDRRIKVHRFDIELHSESTNHLISYNEGNWRCDCEEFLLRNICVHVMAMEEIWGDSVEWATTPVR